MQKEICNLAELGKKVAKLVNNRNIETKAVKEKAESLSDKNQLIPAVVVDAAKAVEEGLDVVDFQSGKPLTEEELENYVVLVDGNHRYQAHLNLLAAKAAGKSDYSGEFWVMYPLNDELTVVEMLSELNIATNPWKGSDYGKCAAIVLGDDAPEGVKAMNELIGMGCNLSSASLWIAFTREITKAVMVKAMNRKETASALTNSHNIQRGLGLYHTAEKAGFSRAFLGKRYFIQWIITKVTGENGVADEEKVQKMFQLLKGLKPMEAAVIEAAKGDKGGESKIIIQERKLNELWDAAQQQ